MKMIEAAKVPPLIRLILMEHPNAENIMEQTQILIDRHTVDAVMEVYGHWEECDWVEYDGHGECVHHPKAGLKCTACCNVFKKDLLWKDNHCPNCGAKMNLKGE
jgi:DNA-directed RNA polymerase subunit RPC12/RpoP